MQSVAVVPIILGAGSAVMPTLFVTLTSIVALLFKPRELLRVSRSRPWVSAGLVAGIVGVVVLAVGFGEGWFAGGAKKRIESASVTSTKVDWAHVAETILAMQAMGMTPTDPAHLLVVNASTGGSPVATMAHAALFEGRDAARSASDGKAGPIGLQRLWRYMPEDGLILSAPLVADGFVYLSACQADLGGYTGLLVCVEAATGKVRWQVSELGGDSLKPFFSSPALTADGKSLIVGQGLHEDRNCALMCFDAATGKLRWSVKSPLHIESSPVIAGDVAVVGAGAIEGKDGRPTGDPGYAFAVRISDGKLLWKQAVNDPESSPGADAEGNIYIGSGFNGSALAAMRSGSDAELKAADQERMLWKTSTTDPVTGSVTVVGDLVIAGSGNSDVVHSAANPHGAVTAFDRKTGAIRWQATFADAVLGSVATRDGIVLCPVRTGEVVALTVADGKELWRTRISGSAPVIAGCALTGGRAYAAAADGTLAVLDAKSGAVLQKILLNDPAKAGTGLGMSPPQVVDGRLYVGSETGGLQCWVGGK